MLDVFNIAKNDSTWIFYANTSGATSNNEWQIWQKPKNCKFVYIFALGGGAGGAGGVSGPSGNRSGGGGGAAASATFGLFPAALLPDNLNILVGKGGAGGAANTNGSAGSISYVSFGGSLAKTNLLLASADSTAAAGTSGGLGGTAGGVFTQANGFLSYLGVIDTMIGSVGAPALGSLTPTTMTCGGAGGGSFNGSNNAGGSINATTFSPLISGGAGGGTNPGYDGICTSLPNSGLVKLGPTMFIGASGGGSHNIGTAGAGGNGSFGCGGAGGGAGVTAGRGGNGGDGIIIISTW